MVVVWFDGPWGFNGSLSDVAQMLRRYPLTISYAFGRV
jgi:hypothetical protein